MFRLDNLLTYFGSFGLQSLKIAEIRIEPWRWSNSRAETSALMNNLSTQFWETISRNSRNKLLSGIISSIRAFFALNFVRLSSRNFPTIFLSIYFSQKSILSYIFSGKMMRISDVAFRIRPRDVSSNESKRVWRKRFSRKFSTFLLELFPKAFWSSH